MLDTLLSLLMGLTIVWAASLTAVALLCFHEVQACFERDPAAGSRLEVLMTYSGLHAIVFHRINHRLWLWRVPILPRLLSQVARLLTGIEIHPGAMIGRGLFIDHGMGVVIGETTVIGDDVTLFQGATLGGTGKERGKRHPTIEDRVVVGAGAKILGNITIGSGSLIGANAVLIRNVPSNSTVVGVPGRVVREPGRYHPGINLDHTSLPDPVAERIKRLQHEIDAIEEHLKGFRQSNVE